MLRTTATRTATKGGLVVMALLLLLVFARQVQANGLDCREGITQAIQGNPAKALDLWGAVPHEGYKERVVTTVRCLRQAGLAATKQEAMKWLADAAAEGSSNAKIQLGLLYVSKTNIETDDQKAFSLVKEASDMGNPDALFVLASFYASGVGVTKDMEEHTKLLEQAAEAGSIYAQERLESRGP